MKIHGLLKRQLDKSGIDYEKIPDSLEAWHCLMGLINKSYVEADQERYLLERSMEISSRELIDINGQLERAQNMAALCYWHYSKQNRLITWSKGIYTLLYLDPLQAPPTVKDFLKKVHPDDLALLNKNLRKAEKMDVNFEIRLKIKNEQYEWFRVMISLVERDRGREFSGILFNINSAKEAADKIKELNRTLVTTARLAGMSEVATIILHNIGNILNSANVSLSIVKQNLSIEHSKKLALLVTMMNENTSSLGDYLLSNRKGKLILPYLTALAHALEKECHTNIEEITHLDNHIKHIKEIVSLQNSLSGVPGVTEKIQLSELLETAIEMANVAHSEIILTRKIDKDSNTLVSEKSKLLQIITNLLRNAKQAVTEDETKKIKKIDIIVNKLNGKIKLRVSDNGIGVLQENLKRIFSFGFTTKVNGHGFGLHSSAISAKELGGSLNVISKGLRKGAEFTLILPNNSLKVRSNNLQEHLDE